MSKLKSKHQLRVEKFMLLAKQEVPESVIVPNEEVRRLRAKLILEEALETIAALGFEVNNEGEIVPFMSPRLIDIIDGCCDLKVVTTGTLSAFGLPDKPFQKEVDEANLRKFGPGSYLREDGKWIKPPDFVPPDFAIEAILRDLQ